MATSLTNVLQTLAPVLNTGATAVVTGSAAYQQNRERVGVVLHEGFRYGDMWVQARPWVFAACLAGAGVSGFGWYKRGLKRRNIEGNLLYPAATLACLAGAYLTRPAWLLPGAVAKQAQTQPPGDGQGLVAWIDVKAADLRQKDPAFADKAIARALAMPAVAAGVQSLPSPVRALIK